MRRTYLGGTTGSLVSGRPVVVAGRVPTDATTTTSPTEAPTTPVAAVAARLAVRLLCLGGCSF